MSDNSTQWKYTMLPMIPASDQINTNPTEFIDVMNGLGDLGFELVCIHNDVMIFKKPCYTTEK